MKALGADIYRTPTEVPSSDPRSNLGVAERICKELGKKAFEPDQYSNENNWKAHYENTAMEIWQSCEGRVDAVVMGVGTGGTISGVGRRLKELNPNIKIVGVDPEGSLLAGGGPDVGKPYQVEGIGYDFIPDVMDTHVVDLWIKVNDRESFQMARRLIKEEGLLCGGSGGSALCGTLSAVKKLGLDSTKRVVVILPDSVRNYMTKFISDDWMLVHGFMDPQETEYYKKEGKNETIKLNEMTRSTPVVDMTATGRDLLRFSGESVVAVSSKDSITGVVQMAKFAIKMLHSDRDVLEANVLRLMAKEFFVLPTNTTMDIAKAYLSTGFPIFVADEPLDKNSTSSSVVNESSKTKSASSSSFKTIPMLDLQKFISQ